MKIKKLLFFFTFLCITRICTAQVDSMPSQIDTLLATALDTTEIDSLINIAASDTILTKKEKRQAAKNDSIVGFFSIFKGNPGKAAFYSLVIPGGGQFYNKRYLRAPMAIAADATALGVSLYWRRQYNNLDIAYKQLLNGEIIDIGGITSTSSIALIRDDYRKYRDYSWFALGIVHFVTVIEAFVDRHLIEFDISDDLTLDFVPKPVPGTQALFSMTLTF